MCLDKYKYFKLPENGIGYKVFVKIGDDEYRPPFFGHEFRLNEWIHDEREFKIEYENDDNRYYPTGFHVFTNFADAQTYRGNVAGDGLVVRKVEFKNVVTRGLQDKCKCIVCRSLKILKEGE